jgi:hypothetical protein
LEVATRTDPRPRLAAGAAPRRPVLAEDAFDADPLLEQRDAGIEQPLHLATGRRRGHRQRPPHAFEPRGAASMPPILCGDFDAEPMSEEIRFLIAKAVI